MTLTNWDDIFVGREEIIDQMLHSNGSSFIFGARRIGKTSLLRFLEKKFWGNNCPAFLFSLEGIYSSEKVKGKIRLSFKRKQFVYDKSLLENNSLFEYFEELDIQLKHPIVFLIDEAEQIVEIDKREIGFVDNFRNCIESVQNIRFIFTASPYIKKLIARSHCSAFLSAFKFISILPIMTEHEISELIRKIFPDVSDIEIKETLKYTHYQPYFVRIFIQKRLNNGILLPASEAIALKAYVDFALNGIMLNYFEGLNRDNQKLVEKIYSNEYKFSEKDEPVLHELTQYGYLKIENGVYKISNWFFERWLRSRNSHEIVEISDDKILSHKQTASKAKKKRSSFQTILTSFATIVGIIAALFALKDYADENLLPFKFNAEVQDSVTKQPIKDVTVIFEDKSAKDTTHTSTEGGFSFKLNNKKHTKIHLTLIHNEYERVDSLFEVSELTLIKLVKIK